MNHVVGFFYLFFYQPSVFHKKNTTGKKKKQCVVLCLNRMDLTLRLLGKHNTPGPPTQRPDPPAATAEYSKLFMNLMEFFVLFCRSGRTVPVNVPPVGSNAFQSSGVIAARLAGDAAAFLIIQLPGGERKSLYAINLHINIVVMATVTA